MKPCLDRPRLEDGKCNPWFVVKWVFKYLFFAALIGQLIAFKPEVEQIPIDKDGHEIRLRDEYAEKASHNFEVVCIIYVLQHVLFMLIRAPAFWCWTVLTVCCDPGRNYPPNHRFKDSIISFDYVLAYDGNDPQIRNNIAGIAGVRQEIDLQRSISSVRQQRLN